MIKKETVDLILSQSVLEHVVDLENTYRSSYLWLRPKGMMSHQIDYTSHKLSKRWNGFRKYSELMWKLINGKRTFLINRQPHSVHRNLLIKNNFEIKCELKNYRNGGIRRKELSEFWKDISDDDLNCSGAFIQAAKL